MELHNIKQDNAIFYNTHQAISVYSSHGLFLQEPNVIVTPFLQNADDTARQWAIFVSPQRGGNAIGTCVRGLNISMVSVVECGCLVTSTNSVGNWYKKKLFGVARGSTWESMASLWRSWIGDATTQASHVNILIDPLFLRMLYTGFPMKSVSHATGIVGAEFVQMEGFTNHTRRVRSSFCEVTNAKCQYIQN